MTKYQLPVLKNDQIWTSNIARPLEFHIDKLQSYIKSTLLHVLIPLSEYFLCLLCICGWLKNINDLLVCRGFQLFFKASCVSGSCVFCQWHKHTVSYPEKPSPIIKSLCKTKNLKDIMYTTCSTLTQTFNLSSVYKPACKLYSIFYFLCVLFFTL